jgi:hypothetical protein
MQDLLSASSVIRTAYFVSVAGNLSSFLCIFLLIIVRAVLLDTNNYLMLNAT